MEHLNDTPFLLINAPEHPGALALALATFLAEYFIWTVPALLMTGWLRGGESARKAMLAAAAAGLLGLLVNTALGLLWQHPRPFMIGLGHTLIPHAADSSFPSDHLTLWWAVAFSLMAQRRSRGAAALALLGVPIAWARVYLGVHFPFDMLGSLAVAALSAWLTAFAARWWLSPAYRLATGVEGVIFGRLAGSMRGARP